MASSSNDTSAKKAFSWSRFRAALDDRVRSKQVALEFLFRHRLWLVAVSCCTLFTPVLENDNTANLNWSQTSSLTGFDVLVPVVTRINLFSGVVASRSFSIHPLGIAIYLPLVVYLYLLFVNHALLLKWVFGQASVQTASTILLPFAHIALLTFVLPGFSSTWHCQSVLFGFWILLICGAANLAASYHELIRIQEVTSPAALNKEI